MISDRKDYDDFWDFKAMLPPKKKSAVFSRDTEAVEIDLDAGVEDNTDTAYRIPARKIGNATLTQHLPTLDQSYRPSNALIKSISIYRWPSKYTFYERFLANAQKYHYADAEECEYVPFFSYIPQYIQLTKEQLNYYLWWRKNQRQGIKIKTDYSYVLLYIYEIINIPNLIEPSDGIILLSKLFLDWREDFPKLDKCMPDWICDYCCIYKLNPPLDLLQDVIGTLQSESSFREFFLPFNCNSNDILHLALLSLGCTYNWRKSKFYNSDTSFLFEKHIPGCFIYVAKKLSLTDDRLKPDNASLPVLKLTRDAFSGSLCAYNVKRRIDIEYYSISRSPQICELITGIVKFSENQIRSIVHIRSRLSSVNLDDKVKRSVLEYFAPYLAKAKKEALPETEPEYMKQYESATSGLTPELAAEIEKRSWDITEKLVESFVEDDTLFEQTDDTEPLVFSTAQNNVTDSSLSREDTAKIGLRYLCNNDLESFNLWAKSLHMLPDSAVEFINEQFYDEIGDICIESDGNEYRIIEDYLDDIKKMI